MVLESEHDRQLTEWMYWTTPLLCFNADDAKAWLELAQNVGSGGGTLLGRPTRDSNCANTAVTLKAAPAKVQKIAIASNEW